MLKKTSLYEAHRYLGAKMGAFAGYDMPLYYSDGVLKEHEWVRSSCGVFDVSHMGQAMVVGEGAREFVEELTPSSYRALPIGHAKYSVLLNESGGIIDDLMVTHAMENAFHFVFNAGGKNKVIEWIKAHLKPALKFIFFDEWALLALQGPQSERVIKEVLNLDLSDMPYMSMRAFHDNSLFISRLGYTGEDGFEIAIRNHSVEALWKSLIGHENVKPIGLAARDSLRLEMGYCLYGHDIDENTTPIEADLGWVIGKNNKNFIGAEIVLRQREQGASKKRVGIKLNEKAIAREGADIFDQQGAKIGHLTSGGFSPTLQTSIGQGYVDFKHVVQGTKILIDIRGRKIDAEITPMPFIKPKTKSSKA